MKTQSILKRGLLAAAALTTVATGFAPAAAFAQTAYDQNGGYYYDPCRRDQTQRAVVGGIVGALAGMALGNNSSHHPYRRDNNAVIGTMIGGAAGAGIGASSAGCAPAPRTVYRQTYRSAPVYRYAPPPPAYYDNYYDDYAYAQPEPPPVYSAPPAYDYGRPPLACTYVESPIRMPDGHVQKRMVQVCPDRNGEYQVVQ